MFAVRLFFFFWKHWVFSFKSLNGILLCKCVQKLISHFCEWILNHCPHSSWIFKLNCLSVNLASGIYFQNRLSLFGYSSAFGLEEKIFVRETGESKGEEEKFLQEKNPGCGFLPSQMLMDNIYSFSHFNTGNTFGKSFSHAWVLECVVGRVKVMHTMFTLIMIYTEEYITFLF